MPDLAAMAQHAKLCGKLRLMSYAATEFGHVFSQTFPSSSVLLAKKPHGG
jgi:hypothetical protein